MAAKRATSNTSDPKYIITDNPSINNHRYHQPVISLEDCKKKKGLPDDFASTIMQLEISMEEKTIEIFHIKDLLEMYMIGVEYYESIGDQRYIYFQKKMNNLLIQQNVIASIEKQHALNNPDDTKELITGDASPSSPYLKDLLQQPLEQGKSTTDCNNEDIAKKTAKQKIDFFQEIDIFKRANDKMAKQQARSMQVAMKDKVKIISSILQAQNTEILHRLRQRKNKQTQTLHIDKNNNCQDNQIINRLEVKTENNSNTKSSINSNNSTSTTSFLKIQPPSFETAPQILNTPIIIEQKDTSFSQPSLSLNESQIPLQKETSISYLEEDNDNNQYAGGSLRQKTKQNSQQQLNTITEKRQDRKEQLLLFQQNPMTNATELDNDILRKEDDEEELRHQ